MATSVQIRPAQPDEYAAVGALSVEVYIGDELLPPGHSYVDQLADAAGRADGSELLVAVDGTGSVLGSVTFVPFGSRYTELAEPGEAEIRMLVVSPQSRGQGLGEALVRASLERARACGAARMRLSTQPNMVRALPIYRRLGFVRTPELDWSPTPGLQLRTYVLEMQASTPS